MRLRKEEKAARRQALIDAGLELFRQQGFASTTVDQITSRAGVAKGAFYSYFPTKEDLVLQAIPLAQSGSREPVERWLAEPRPTRERILTALRPALAWIEAHGELIWIYTIERFRRGRPLLENGSRSPFAHLLTQIFTLGQTQGDVRSDRTPSQLALDLEGIMLAHIAAWYHQDTPLSLPDSLLPAVEVYLDGALLSADARQRKERNPHDNHPLDA
ncbi:MAG: TetR/AcrR family transcriptional regulator [Bacillota bacterium]